MPNAFNGLVSPPPWSFTKALTNVDFAGYNISNVGLINGSPPGSGAATLSTIQHWALYPALSNLNMANCNITNAGNIQFSSINGVQYAAPSQWSGFPATQNINAANNNIVSVANLGVSSINGLAFTNAAQWSQFNATQGVNMNNQNVSNIANLQVSSINGAAPGGGGGGSPNTWSQFAATQNVNMGNNGISNASFITCPAISTTNIQLTTINGAAYPPPINAMRMGVFTFTGNSGSSAINIGDTSYVDFIPEGLLLNHWQNGAPSGSLWMLDFSGVRLGSPLQPGGFISYGIQAFGGASGIVSLLETSGFYAGNNQNVSPGLVLVDVNTMRANGIIPTTPPAVRLTISNGTNQVIDLMSYNVRAYCYFLPVGLA